MEEQEIIVPVDLKVVLDFSKTIEKLDAAKAEIIKRQEQMGSSGSVENAEPSPQSAFGRGNPLNLSISFGPDNITLFASTCVSFEAKQIRSLKELEEVFAAIREASRGVIPNG
jgi:hypothetical protein